MIWLWLACTGGEAPATFGVLADQVPGGVLLSGWWDGARLRMVGGQVDGRAGLFAEWDGATLCTTAAPGDTLWWIHGTKADDWYAVGHAGTILHHTGGALVDERAPTTATLYGVWADDGGVWAVGGDPDARTGELWARVDGAWALQQATAGTLFKVWRDWIVGDGVALHREAGAWVDRTPPGAPKLLTVSGRADDDVWAVGGTSQPVVVHWDGAAWSTPEVDPYCAARPLAGVWTAEGEGVWFAGMFGTVGGLLPDGRWACPDLPVTQEHLHAAVQTDTETLFLGGNLMTGSDNYGTIVRYPAPVAEVEAVPCR